MRFPLQILSEGDVTLERDDGLVNGNVSVWVVYCIEGSTETIKERLYLPLLGSALWITYVQGSKDLGKSFPRKDGSEDRLVVWCVDQ